LSFEGPKAKVPERGRKQRAKKKYREKRKPGKFGNRKVKRAALAGEKMPGKGRTQSSEPHSTKPCQQIVEKIAFKNWGRHKALTQRKKGQSVNRVESKKGTPETGALKKRETSTTSPVKLRQKGKKAENRRAYGVQKKRRLKD